MKISASLRNSAGGHDVTVSSAGTVKSLPVPTKVSEPGSGISGGEFLMLALATCYCNDLYREARRLGIVVAAVEVEASADFDGVGLSARNIRYRARVTSDAPAEAIGRLLRETDAVAEIHNTLRAGADVRLTPWGGTGRADAV